MRFTDLIGSQADYMQYRSIKPKYYPCPQCGKKGKRKRVMTRRIPHVAVLHRRSWIVAEVGVYQARCACCKCCALPPGERPMTIHPRTSQSRRLRLIVPLSRWRVFTSSS
jgi:hypothetical protein